MKNIIIALALFIGISANAQERSERGERNPEQIAEVMTKKMTLKYNLTDAQAKQVYPLVLNQATARIKKSEEMRAQREKMREERKDREDRMAQREEMKKERREMMNDHLDDQIAFQRSIQDILNEEQFNMFLEDQQKRNQARQKGRKDKRPKDGDRRKRRGRN